MNSKYKALVHYICCRCPPDKSGATELNKILWFSDMLFYVGHGRTITGDEYIRRQFGPVPRNILNILEQLEGEEKLFSIKPLASYGYPQQVFIPLEEATTDGFSAEEIDLINRVIQKIGFEHTASSISELTHNHVWEIAQIGETIPPAAFLMSPGGAEINKDDMDWAKKQIQGIAA